MMIFYLNHSSYIYWLIFYCKLSLLSFYLFKWFVFISVGVNLLFILRLKFSHIWLMGATASRLWVLFDMTLSVLNIYFLTHKMFQLHLVLHVLQPQYQPFFQGPPISFSWGIVFKNQDLSAGLVLGWHCFYVLLADRARREIHTYTHVYTFTYIHIHLSLYHFQVYVSKTKSSHCLFGFSSVHLHS